MLNPNVTCTETDHSERISIDSGMNSHLIAAGRRCGKSMLTAQLMKNKYQMQYNFDSKLPVFAYLANNEAFSYSKNKLPRGAQRRINHILREKRNGNPLLKSLKDQKEKCRVVRSCGHPEEV